MSTYASKPLTFSDAADVSKMSVNDDMQLRLHGVHHTARATWKLKETVTFYRDILGLPLVHCITARGWGREGHPDFLHFFFDSGCGGLIAFFYYLGVEKPTDMRPADEVLFRATHTSWAVESREELLQWKEVLESRGVDVSPVSYHELIESIYFADPNGYPLEVSYQIRDICDHDGVDADLSLSAALALESGENEGNKIANVEQIWQHKGQLLSDSYDDTGPQEGVLELFVLDVPEFRSIVDFALENADCEVDNSKEGYFRIRSSQVLVLNRSGLRLKPPVWYGVCTGGIRGKILEFGRDELHIGAL